MFPTTPLPLYTQLGFQLAFTLLLLLYTFWIILARNNHGGVRELLYNSLQRRLRQYHSQHKIRSSHRGMLLFAQLLWSFAFSLFALRMMDEVEVLAPLLRTPLLTPLYRGLIFAAVPLLYHLYYLVALFIWAIIAKRTGFVKDVIIIKLMSSTLSVTVMGIALLCYLLVGSIPPAVPIGCFLFIVLNSLRYDIFSSFALFSKENISNLSWFLYLCTVEIIPLVAMGVIIMYK